MLLEDLYQRLSYGELNNLSMAADGNGVILDSGQPRITMYANEALVRLYTTFVLRTNSLHHYGYAQRKQSASLSDSA